MSNRVYISGPIDHLDYEERVRAFERAECRLKIMGYNAVNPIKNGLPKEASRQEHMRQDLLFLLTCDIIYMLAGWEQSKGCKLELDVATTIGCKVLMEHPSNYVLHDAPDF